MVDAKEVKPNMNTGELEISIEKRWITRDSLVQQIDCLELFVFRQKNFGARVKIERADVGRRGTFDGVLFAWRKFCLQLICDCFCDLALNGEHVRQVAV